MEVLNLKEYIYIYLYHLEYPFLTALLKKTGWNSIEDYQLSNINNKIKFQCIVENNKLYNLKPIFNNEQKNKYFVTNISLINLIPSVRQSIAAKYFKIPIDNYLLHFGNYDKIFIYIAYNQNNNTNQTLLTPFNFTVGSNNTNIDKESYEEPDIKFELPGIITPPESDEEVKNNESINENLVNKDNESYECSIMEGLLDEESENECSDEESNYDNKILSGYAFKLNTVTDNSYILYPIVVSSPKNTNYGWKLFNNYRNIYYSHKYKGWIVGLNKKNDMLNMGALEM